MKKEIVIFDDIEGLKKSAADTKVYLTKLKEEYESRVTHLKEMTERLSRENSTLKSQLKEIKTDQELQVILKKIRDREQSVFNMSETIERTLKATNYAELKKKCMECVGKINQENINIQLGV